MEERMQSPTKKSQPPQEAPAQGPCRLTMRDTFAAHAMAGWVANGDWCEGDIPSRAYQMADLMLAERDRTYDAQPRDLFDDQQILQNAADVLGPGGFKELARRLLSLSRRLADCDAVKVVRIRRLGIPMQPEHTRGWNHALSMIYDALEAAGVKWEFVDE